MLAWNPLLVKKEIFPIIVCIDILYASLITGNSFIQLVYW